MLITCIALIRLTPHWSLTLHPYENVLVQGKYIRQGMYQNEVQDPCYCRCQLRKCQISSEQRRLLVRYC